MKSITIQGFIPPQAAQIIEETFNSFDLMFHSGQWTAEQHEEAVVAYIAVIQNEFPSLIEIHDNEDEGVRLQ